MIEFNFLEKTTLRDRLRLKSFLALLCEKEKMELESLSIVFCSDEYLLQINKDYLKHDFYTDIITFDYSAGPRTIIGEMYISVTRVKENAGSFGSTFQRELHRVIFHGLLHLCGYKDKTPAASKKMREREDHYLRLYF